MSARPAIRTITNVARLVPRRQYHITDPVNLHETSSTADISDVPRRATAGSQDSSDSSVNARKFGTTTRLSAWRDTSSIDFAFLPVALDPDSSTDNPIRVPLLLETMYSGVQARAMYEDEPEATLKPLINLISADSTHISTPSALSEVLDNTSLAFEGISSTISSATNPSEEDSDVAGSVKQFFRELMK